MIKTNKQLPPATALEQSRAGSSRPLLRDLEHITRLLDHRGKGVKRARIDLDLRALLVPSFLVVAPLTLLLALTALCAWLGSALPIDREIDGRHFERQLPDGTKVRAHLRGWAPDSAYLPRTGNDPYDEFETSDGLHWVWLPLTGTPSFEWVDP
jgi:hypothetical protein